MYLNKPNFKRVGIGQIVWVLRSAGHVQDAVVADCRLRMSVVLRSPVEKH